MQVGLEFFPGLVRESTYYISTFVQFLTPLEWLFDIFTKITTFDVDDATKNYNKIIDLGPYKGQGVGYD